MYGVELPSLERVAPKTRKGTRACKMQKNGSNPVKEIVRHVKDNQSAKAPPTPPLLSMILESRSLHIQKQPQQHNHISRQESAGISVEPSNECGLHSVINSTDGEGKNDVEDTWDDDSLFEEDSFIIQATQNSELLINKLAHSTSAHGKQTAIIAKETQLLSQTLELYCGTSDADKIITTSPSLTETKTEHFTVSGTSYEENVNIGAEKTVTEKTISAPRISHSDFQILCGASSGDLAESPKSRFAAKTKCLGKLGQRVDYKLDLSQQVMGTHIHAQMLDFDPSVSCVAQLFSHGIGPGTQVPQANSRKDVASVQQDCIKAYPCVANHSESATQGFRNPIGMTNKFYTAENIRSTLHGKQVSGHNSNDKLQCCQMEAESTSGYSPWNNSSSKCPLDADKNSVRKCSNQNLPENVLQQIIKIDDVLDSQVIEEYPTPLLTWPLMPETLARPTAPAADYDVDEFDDSYCEGLESISQFESFEGLSQKGRRVENNKQYVVHIPEDSIEDDFTEIENSAVLPSGPCGQNDCKQPKLCLGHTHKGVCSASQVKHGSKRSSLVFKGDIAFKGSMSELHNSALYKQNSKPFRDCIQITNGDEESDNALRKTGNFQQNWHESGPRGGPLTTLVKGNAMLEVDAVAGRMTVLKPVNIVQSTSLLAGKPVAITNRLALHTEAPVREYTSCNDDMMEFADEALFESQILALLDETRFLR
ncbi:hypothetical protein C0Q70_13591 [Pomacea canaliculata]|uniref:Uncharacterized protein n=1 Tax=Pomacea canaliculata TaxID=400727 RepID=A0A2T7NXN7_POMCA|nr:hypothetical protein C0Q70_13591 [Pomacea canaliculata]